MQYRIWVEKKLRSLDAIDLALYGPNLNVGEEETVILGELPLRLKRLFVLRAQTVSRLEVVYEQYSSTKKRCPEEESLNGEVARLMHVATLLGEELFHDIEDLLKKRGMLCKNIGIRKGFCVVNYHHVHEHFSYPKSDMESEEWQNFLDSICCLRYEMRPN